VRVTYCPQYLPPQRIVEKIEALGYGAHEYSSEQESSAGEKRDLLLRLGLAGFLWANIMSLSLVVYAGYFEPISPSVRRYLPFLLMALATPAVLYCAAPIFRLAWRGLLHGAIRMEALLALGIGSAYLCSVLQAFKAGLHLYFDTVSVIVMLVLAGKLIEREAKAKATR
jgi:cation transport ATPase